ncbi:MAG: RNA polymerase sigma-70 factor (ECF subfamily) [Planctomycetota bacterium]|jgi:RNA polymerase sigma-70 factor (ECF subfamily)
MDHPSPVNEPTRALLDRAQAGDMQAAEQLFEQAAERVLLFIRLRLGAKLGRELDPMDVLQETWVAALEGFQRFDAAGTGAFAAWLCRLAENRMADLARRGGRLKRTPPGQRQAASVLLDRAKHSATGPLTAAVRGERGQRLSEAIEQLDQEEREVALLRHFQELSVEDIAERVGASASAVRRRLGRALASLGRAMGEDKSHG